VSGTPPWVIRVTEIKASAAINVEAERKVVQLNDEIQALVRNLKSKDQHIQESSVKIELMERRMETVKKQADAIADLESELAKAGKRERSYEEAMEQLQSDLDVLEQDNVKLKAVAANPEKQGKQQIWVYAPTNDFLQHLRIMHWRQRQSKLRATSRLRTCSNRYFIFVTTFGHERLDELQIEAYRGTVRYLRTENSYLRGQDLLREIQALPPLREESSRTPTPPLEPSGLSDTDDDSDPESPPRPPRTLRSLATETKLLYRDVIKFSSSPRVVDLSVIHKKGEDGTMLSGRGWLPRKKMPAHQVWERKMEAEKLNRRVRGLMERASAIGGNL
jgi:dynactin 1